MIETENSLPLTAEQGQDRSMLPTFDWTATDELDVAITHALVDALDVDETDFVLQQSIDTEALAQLVCGDSGWATPTDVQVSFRLEGYDCNVIVDSDRIRVRSV